MQLDWAVGGGPCWWCGKPSLGRVWGQGDEQWMSICPECVRAMKAVLPDAPDWGEVAREAAIKLMTLSNVAFYPELNRQVDQHQNAQAILEAAHRLVEATRHLDTTPDKGID